MSDALVVGGGSSGCALAGRLVEAGLTVTLVEAGPDYGALADGRWPTDLADARLIPQSHDWGYISEIEDDRDEPIALMRARVMGGCSAHNGCVAAVGHPSDYDDWNLPGWSSGDVRPLFAAVLERMRVRVYSDDEAGPYHRACLDGAASLGWPRADDLHDLDGGVGFGLEAVNVFGDVRFNAAFAYLDPVRSSGRLTIVDHAEVDRVERVGRGWRVVGRRGSLPLLLTADRVVLSAGVYGSPAILQRSGIGDPALLTAVGVRPTHRLPGVGANLHDHPSVEVDFTVTARLSAYQQAALATGFLPDEQTLGKFESSRANGIYDLHLYPVCASNQVGIFAGRALIVASAVKPRSRGRLQITGSDPSADPIIDHGYLSDPEGHDLAVLMDGVELAYELAASSPLTSLIGAPITPYRDPEVVRRHHVHYYHPVGTCRMGALDDPGSVCDADGQVIGLDGLYVADCSSIPFIPRANTNMPGVMIGERIARSLVASGAAS